MDSEFEELESLFSDHFGRTPISTPFASQENDTDSETDDCENENQQNRLIIQAVIDSRVSNYIVQQDVTSCTPTEDDTDAHFNKTDDSDEDISKITAFMKKGCGCKRKCTGKINLQRTLDHIFKIRETTKEEKEVYIMGSLVNSHHEETTKRKRLRTCYSHHEEFICRNSFMLMFDIGRHALEALVTHFKNEGPIPRSHGNSGKKPKHALTFDDVKRVVEFIQNFSDAYGLPQPAAPRGIDNLSPIYLESGTTKLNLHKDYVRLCEESSVRAIKLTSFKDIWTQCIPHVKLASPREDVCATCEKHRQNIHCAIEEEEKLSATADFRDHVITAQKERELLLGQNKNRYMIGYLQWRILTVKNDTIEYQMQIPGHAKCLVDSGFGHLKKLYRRSNTETLDQLTDVVEKSSEVNSAVRYPEWKWMDWNKFLEPVFKPIPGIRKYQYFRMAIEEPGMVTVRTGADEPQTVIDIRKQNFVLPTYTPDVIRAEGLRRQRQEYLYKNVRPYLTEASKDITCPAPV